MLSPICSAALQVTMGRSLQSKLEGSRSDARLFRITHEDDLLSVLGLSTLARGKSHASRALESGGKGLQALALDQPGMASISGSKAAAFSRDGESLVMQLLPKKDEYISRERSSLKDTLGRHMLPRPRIRRETSMHRRFSTPRRLDATRVIPRRQLRSELPRQRKGHPGSTL